MCLFEWRVKANRGTAEGSRGGEGVNVSTQAGLLNTQCPFDLCAELNVWGKPRGQRLERPDMAAPRLP